MKLVRAQAKIFVSALPQESVIANMARRVLRLIREEYDACKQAVSVQKMFSNIHKYCNGNDAFKLFQSNDSAPDDSQGTPSLHKLVTQTSESERSHDYSKPQQGLRVALLDHLQEIETELETSAENLSGKLRAYL